MQKTKITLRILSVLAVLLLAFTMLPAGALVGAADTYESLYRIRVHGNGEEASANVAGAEVILESAGRATVSAVSDANGLAVFSIENGNAVVSGANYYYTIKKTGYTTLRSADTNSFLTVNSGVRVVDIYADFQPPVIHRVTQSLDSGWTKGPVTITVAATDNVGIDAYSFDGGATWQPENYVEVNNNVVFEPGTIKIKDTAGNITSYFNEVSVSNIDNVAPVIHTVQLFPNIETNDSVTIEIIADDNRWDATLEYSTDGGVNWSPNPYAMIAANTVISENSIMVRDDAGNETAYPFEIRLDKINKLAPTILSVTPDIENAVPTNGAVTIRVAAVFNSSAGYAGRTDLWYSFNGGASWQPDNFIVITENQTIPAGTIKVKDAAGNIATYSLAVAVSNIDTEAPIIENIEVKNRAGEIGGWDAMSNTVSFSIPDDDVARVWVQTTNIVDFATAALVPDGKTCSFTVNDNQTVYLFAMDLAGNLREAVPVVISKIDKTAPVVDAPAKNPAREWHNGAVEITVTASDRQTSGDLNGAGINRVIYSTYSGYATALANDALQEAVFDPSSGEYCFSTPNEAFVGNYYIWAVDQVGHVSEAVSIYIQIDKAAPADPAVSYVKDPDKGFVKELINILTFSLFFKDKVTITVSAHDDESGIAGYQYQLVPVGGTISDTAWIDIASVADSAEFTVPYETFAGKLYIRVWDVAGNVTEAVTDLGDGTTIVMDNTSAAAPTVVLNGRLANEWTGAWTNSDVVIALSGSDPVSGVDYYQYRVDYADPSVPDTDWTMMPDTDGSVARAEGGTIPNKLTISADMDAQIYFRAVSNTAVAGTSSAAVTIRIQKTTPDNAVCLLAPTNGRDTEGQDTGWYVGSFGAPNLTILAPATFSNTAPISIYYKLWNTSRGEVEFDVHEVLFSDAQPEFTADGVYVLKIWTVDAAGNICDDDKVIFQEIKIATTAPDNLTIHANGRSVVAADPDCVVFNVFFNTAVRISLGADFGISGQDSLAYQKVRNASQYNPSGTWTAYNPATGIAVDPSDRFVIYFRAEDMAGNVAIIHTDGIILDSQAPTGESGAPDLSVAPEDASASGFYNDDVSVGISVRDPKYLGSALDEINGICSGLESITYRVIADGVETKSTTILFPIAGTSYVRDEDGLVETWSGSVLVAAQENNSNSVVVEVTAVDNAGNSRTTRTPQGTIKIDITNPTIDISYDNNKGDAKSGSDAFFNAGRLATITITERNFRPEDAVVAVTKDGARVSVDCNWQMVNPGSGNGDDRTYQATIRYHDDGDYTFSIAYTDLAGNANKPVSYAAGTVAPEGFSVDQTPPQIEVTYNNNAAVNGKYFNKGRTATITVTERNFDPARVTITRTASLGGVTVNLQTAPVWTDLGNGVYTFTLENIADGDYMFDIAMEDRAGNRNSSVKYGSSAAPGAFTIDTKFETLTVSGVEDGKSYNSGIGLFIRFQDLNYDRYEIALTRTRWGARNVDVTEEFVPRVHVDEKGGAVTLNTFEKKQENDGIYTLSVTVYDKAGNVKTIAITFTLNRFGSVYIFNDSLVALQDSYVKSVDEPLVITEYNPNRLVEGSLTIEITRDGAPLNDVRYSVDPPIDDTVPVSASGWYEYHYTIDPSNFADAAGNPIDGVYKIVVSSQDEADNTPETTNYSDRIILFRIDNVAPEIASIIGLSSRVVNQATLDVEFEIFDAIGLKKITVFVNDTVIKSFDVFDEAGSFIGGFALGQGLNQRVQIRVEDKAGNVTDTNDKDFKAPFEFERSITVSTNFLVRWFANTPVFIGSVISSAVLGGIVWFAIVAKKTKKLFG